MHKLQECFYNPVTHYGKLKHTYNIVRPLQLVVWFMIHRPHQIITIASRHHYCHCACAVTPLASLTSTLILKRYPMDKHHSKTICEYQL